MPLGLLLARLYKTLTHTETAILRLDEDYNEAYGLKKPGHTVISGGSGSRAPVTHLSRDS